MRGPERLARPGTAPRRASVILPFLAAAAALLPGPPPLAGEGVGGAPSLAAGTSTRPGAAMPLPAPPARDTLTLPVVLEGILRQHPSLQALRAAREGARAGEREVRGALLPSVDARAVTTRFELPMVVAPIHALDLSGPRPDFDRTLVQGRVEGRWLLFDGGVSRGLARAAEAGAEGAAAAVDRGAARLLEEGIGAWAAVGTARAVALATAERVRALEADRARAARFLEEGRAARVELLRAEAALQAARADSASAAATVVVTERRLARMTGLDPGAVEGQPLAPMPGEVLLPAGAGGTARAPSPALREARQRMVAAQAAVSASRARHLPRLLAAGGVNRFGGVETRPSTEWDVGVQLQWAVYAGGSRGAALDRARAELRRAEEEVRSVELREAEERDAALAALDEAGARQEALAAAVAGFEEVVRIEELAMEEGIGIQRDLLAARASLTESRAGLARAAEAELRARAALARIDGVLTLSALLDRWPATENPRSASSEEVP